jgi:hypothetical protein
VRFKGGEGESAGLDVSGANKAAFDEHKRPALGGVLTAAVAGVAAGEPTGVGVEEEEEDEGIVVGMAVGEMDGEDGTERMAVGKGGSGGELGQVPAIAGGEEEKHGESYHDDDFGHVQRVESEVIVSPAADDAGGVGDDDAAAVAGSGVVLAEHTECTSDAGVEPRSQTDFETDPVTVDALPRIRSDEQLDSEIVEFGRNPNISSSSDIPAAVSTAVLTSTSETGAEADASAVAGTRAAARDSSDVKVDTTSLCPVAVTEQLYEPDNRRRSVSPERSLVDPHEVAGGAGEAMGDADPFAVEPETDDEVEAAAVATGTATEGTADLAAPSSPKASSPFPRNRGRTSFTRSINELEEEDDVVPEAEEEDENMVLEPAPMGSRILADEMDQEVGASTPRPSDFTELGTSRVRDEYDEAQFDEVYEEYAPVAWLDDNMGSDLPKGDIGGDMPVPYVPDAAIGRAPTAVARDTEGRGNVPPSSFVEESGAATVGSSSSPALTSNAPAEYGKVVRKNTFSKRVSTLVGGKSRAIPPGEGAEEAREPRKFARIISGSKSKKSVDEAEEGVQGAEGVPAAAGTSADAGAGPDEKGGRLTRILSGKKSNKELKLKPVRDESGNRVAAGTMSERHQAGRLTRLLSGDNLGKAGAETSEVGSDGATAGSMAGEEPSSLDRARSQQKKRRSRSPLPGPVPPMLWVKNHEGEDAPKELDVLLDTGEQASEGATQVLPAKTADPENLDNSARVAALVAAPVARETRIEAPTGGEAMKAGIPIKSDSESASEGATEAMRFSPWAAPSGRTIGGECHASMQPSTEQASPPSRISSPAIGEACNHTVTASYLNAYSTVRRTSDTLSEVVSKKFGTEATERGADDVVSVRSVCNGMKEPHGESNATSGIPGPSLQQPSFADDEAAKRPLKSLKLSIMDEEKKKIETLQPRSAADSEIAARDVAPIVKTDMDVDDLASDRDADMGRRTFEERPLSPDAASSKVSRMESLSKRVAAVSSGARRAKKVDKAPEDVTATSVGTDSSKEDGKVKRTNTLNKFKAKMGSTSSKPGRTADRTVSPSAAHEEVEGRASGATAENDGAGVRRMNSIARVRRAFSRRSVGGGRKFGDSVSAGGHSDAHVPESHARQPPGGKGPLQRILGLFGRSGRAEA